MILSLYDNREIDDLVPKFHSLVFLFRGGSRCGSRYRVTAVLVFLADFAQHLVQNFTLNLCDNNLEFSHVTLPKSVHICSEQYSRV